MVLQTHLQCQIISISPATKYNHHSTAILLYTVTSGCTTTSWFLNLKTLFLMCKMIIHYRTYLKNGITNTFAMPNNFYITSNQIQTPLNCYFDIYSDKWMYYYSMVLNLKTLFLMCKMILHYRTYLQNGITISERPVQPVTKISSTEVYEVSTGIFPTNAIDNGRL